MEKNHVIKKIKKTNAPIVVGLDPMLSYVPEHIQKAAFAQFGETLEGAAEAIWQYNKAIVDATYDLIPAVKPQIAMYEQFGVAGVAAFQKTVDYCHEKDLVVIGDVKRGDIGSTSAAYATGHLGKVQIGSKTYTGFNEDFATVNPYLGTDGIKPFVDVCKEEKKGIFILVKTSNPSSGEFQDRLIDGRPLYELVGEKVAEWGSECMGDSYSYVGAVVGATYPEQGEILRKVMPKSFPPPLCYLFTNQFIQRTTVDQTILELSAGWIGGLYENKDSFLFFFAYIHKRLDTIGSQIWIYCSKILIKTGICFASDLYFSEMSGRIGCGCGTDIPTLYISDHNQIFLVAVIYRLLECRYTCHTKLLIHRDLRLHCRNQVVCCIDNSFIVLPDGFCCSL